jgi:rare lipoprotein A
MTKYFVMAFVALSTILPAAAKSAESRVKAPRHAPAGGSFAAGETGVASYYGPGHHGHRTASGNRFDQRELTAAHPWLPFGTKVRVILASTGRSVVVTITDRLYSNRRIVDLSLAAAQQLGMVRAGVGTVTLLPI